MAEVTINVKSNTTNREVTVTKDFGATLQEAVQLFGEDQVLRQFSRMCQTDISNKVRALLNDPAVSPEDAIESVKDWQPGMKTIGVVRNPMETLKSRIASGKMTDAELDEIRELLRARKK